MSTIVAYFVNRPLLVNLLLVTIFVFGLNSIQRIPKESFPQVALNSVTISTIYPGASASDVELNVTTVIEEALQEISGIEKIESFSREGVSSVNVFADEDADDNRFRQIYEDVDGAVSRITDLPPGIDQKPILTRHSTDFIPSLEIALSGPVEDVRRYAEKLERILEDREDIAMIRSAGLPELEAQILVDPEKAMNREVDLLMIAGAIQQRNVEGSGGSMESFLGEKRVVVYSRFRHYMDVLETDIRRSVDGFGIKLKDVAEIRLVEKDDGLEVRSNGEPGASLLVIKKPEADVVRAIDGVREAINQYPPPPSVDVTFLEDRSRLTRSRLQLLGSNALLGILLIAGLLLLVFDRRVALWTAAGIPAALLIMMIILPWFDLTFSALALGAMVIVLGILVDDAIVVAEEIARGRERGLSATEAAIEGVRRIWKPVLASVTTTAVAFSPLIFIGGLPGQFIWVVPLVVVLTLIASMAESFFILPAHLAHGEHRHIKKKKFIVALERKYMRSLAVALKNRYLVLTGFLAVLILSLIAGLTLLEGDAFPDEGAEKFTVRVSVPGEVQLDKTRETIEKIEKEIGKLPPSELEGFSSRIGTQNGQSWSDRGTANNLAIIFVYLTPIGERSRTAPQIVSDLRNTIHDLSSSLNNAEVVVDIQGAGPSGGAPIEYRVSSHDTVKRNRAVAEVVALLEKTPGVIEVETDEMESVDDLNLVLDYETLARAGVSVESLVRTLRIAFDGIRVSYITRPEGTLDFRLRLNQQARANPEFLESLPMASPRTGNMLNLNRFIDLEEQPGVMEIRHLGGMRTTTISARLDGATDTNEVADVLLKNFQTGNEVFFELAGQAESNKAVFGELFTAAGLALMGIYVIIALILNSAIRPILIMSCIPFGIAGVIGGLLLHGLPLSAFAAMGLIGLSGIVVNDSILMAYKIQGAAGTAKITDRSILHGATGRLRPILLTSVTTIGGLAPTAFGIGGYDFFISPMCLAMAYGLFFGTFIVLYLMPCLLRTGEDLHHLTGISSNYFADQFKSIRSKLAPLVDRNPFKRGKGK
jgi:multidrug efflux pump subunit AcrB